MDIKEMYKNAIQELKIANQNVDNAEEDYIDVAILEYNAKQEKVNTLLKELKKEGCLNVSGK